MPKALDRALELFWRKDYEGISLSDLTAALGINRPSLYAAFGDKEVAIPESCRSLRRRFGGVRAQGARIVQGARVVGRLMHGAVDLLTDPKTPQDVYWSRARFLVAKRLILCGVD